MISISLIKKWKNMLLHKSVLHVNQTEGLCYSSSEIKGYYNNLTEKVTFTKLLDEEGIPCNIASYGEEKKQVYFPIAIFQYGLGAYDLYLQTGESSYLAMAVKMADWAVSHQETSGAWNTFGILHYENPYSSMSQGEGISLLVRICKETGEQRYLEAAERAAAYMLTPLTDGGTAVSGKAGELFSTQRPGDLVLMEYPAGACVLNGWIFSAFGLFDLALYTDKEVYINAWKAAVSGIRNSLSAFDTGHWSYYDLGGKYNSPFYHSLHVELLKAVNTLEPDPVFEAYIRKWSRMKNHWFWRRTAFVVKAMQKLTEKKKQEWVLTG